ncbi:MAG TPA: ABC transporter permease [Gemmatimonadales bacterium]|jgi:predicted permease
MSRISHNLKSAFRLLFKRPGFSVIVILTLALGIGLNTAAFSTLDTLLLSPLPGTRNSNELVYLFRTSPGADMNSNSIPHYRDVAARTGNLFSGVTVWDFRPFSMSAGGRAQLFFGQLVAGNYFDLLGAKAERGRLFTPADDSGRGAHPVVVLNYSAWQGMFGADPNIVGRSVVLNGSPYTVIGVTEKDFVGTIRIVRPALWAPLSQLGQLYPQDTGYFNQRNQNFLEMWARLKPGVTIAQARAAMPGLIAGLKDVDPVDYKDAGMRIESVAESGIHPAIKSSQVGLTSVVIALVGALLLIACVNVANLFLARARDRSREMAIRLAIGAGRKALITQLLVESLVIALASGVVGLALGRWVMALVNRVKPPFALEVSANLHLSPRVLLFTLLVSVVTALLFGLAPALQTTRPDLVPALKGAAPGGSVRSRMSQGLVIAQMALSLILLVCSGLFVRDLGTATQVDKGFQSDHALTASMDPGLQGYNRGRTREFYHQLADALAATPGTKAVAFTSNLPLSGGESDMLVTVPGYTPAQHENMGIQYSAVTPGFFAAMAMPVLRGRGFTAQDDSAAAPVIVVNQRFVDRFWPGQDPLGRIVHLESRKEDVRIVGVVPTGKYQRLGEDPTAFMYFPVEQHWDYGMALVARTVGDPLGLVGQLRSSVTALDPNMPLVEVQTLDNYLGFALLPARLAGATLGSFGILGLVLASIGIYGVMAYAVSQRKREIGIRMAIGADAAAVTGLVMREGLTLALIGTGVGLVGAVGAAQLVKTQLYSHQALDLATFGLVPVILLAAAALGVWVPARRASSVDPVTVLRQD